MMSNGPPLHMMHQTESPLKVSEIPLEPFFAGPFSPPFYALRGTVYEYPPVTQRFPGRTSRDYRSLPLLVDFTSTEAG